MTQKEFRQQFARLGGKARAAKLTPTERSDQARKAANAMHDKRRLAAKETALADK